MSQDIVPIELGLTQGDVITLWAPKWREDGEEWEAFLGDEEDLYAFPDAAHLAAFVRTATEHDLVDHPAWHVVPALSVGELMPDENHQYDLVGVLELVAEEPDTWLIGELDEIIEIVRSLADVCELEKVEEILQSAEGFGVLHQGVLPFTGRDGERRWMELAKVIADRWGEVLDELEAVLTTPDVDAKALSQAETELAEFEAAVSERAAAEPDDDAELDEAELADAESEPEGFWAEVGIDPIRIVTAEAEYYTLRCYLDDEPVFLGVDGKIDVFGSPRALARYLAEEKVEHELRDVSTWPEIAAKAHAGELDVTVDEDNVYVLNGLNEDLAEGPEVVDPDQLDLASELLLDAADWAGDDKTREALSPGESLGWLVSYIVRPDPTRLAPSAPFDAEVAVWRELVTTFENRLVKH